jgi:hypothetical protein
MLHFITQVYIKHSETINENNIIKNNFIQI